MIQTLNIFLQNHVKNAITPNKQWSGAGRETSIQSSLQ